MSRLDSLIRRVETLEFELAHLAGTAFQVGPLNIANRIMLSGLLKQIDDEALADVARYCLAEAKRQKAEGLSGMGRLGMGADKVAQFSELLDGAASDLQRMVDDEKRRRKGS